MAKSTLNIDTNEMHLYRQAKNSSHYMILNHESNELKTLPIHENLLFFTNPKVRLRYLDILYRNQTTLKVSSEFASNLIIFYSYCCITSLIILFSVCTIYIQNQLDYHLLVFHICSIIVLLLLLFLILYLVVLKQYWMINNQFLYCVYSSFFLLYLNVSNQDNISKILKVADCPVKLNFSLPIIGFLYFYRQIVYDSFTHMLFPSIQSIIIGIILPMAYSDSYRADIISDYLLYSLISFFILIESHKVTQRAVQLFYRFYNEELKNEEDDIDDVKSSFDMISNTELVVEKCDKVIKEINHIKHSIMYIDIKNRLKSCSSSLKDIKKYLGRHTDAEVINFDENSNIPKEDKEFIAQNFLNVKKNSNSKLKGRNLTLKDFIERKIHFSYSHSMLIENLNILEEVGQNWNLDLFDFNKQLGHSVSAIGKHFYKRWCISEILSVSEEIAYRFFEHLEINYQNNPYHNAIHAADVLSSLLYFINHSDIEKFITPHESVASLIAALGHDVGHPGLTNRYLTESKSSLSIRYNDSSILENMHCSMIYTILNEPQCNIFTNLHKDLWNYIRKLIIDMVLYTDMSKHFEVLGRFRARTLSMNDLILEKNEDRTLLLKIGLKCADLGHSAKEFNLHEKWTILISEEFFLQGDLEKKNGMPVSMYCDRDVTDIPKSQNGFLKNVCLPLFEVFSLFLRSDVIYKNCVEQIKENVVKWEDCTRSPEKYKSPQKSNEDLPIHVLPLKG